MRYRFDEKLGAKTVDLDKNKKKSEKKTWTEFEHNSTDVCIEILQYLRKLYSDLYDNICLIRPA